MVKELEAMTGENQKFGSMPQLVEPKAVAEFLNVPESWVRSRTRASCPASSQIPHHRLGKYVRFILPEVQKWIEDGMGKKRG
jgi:hypothetical protein